MPWLSELPEYIPSLGTGFGQPAVPASGSSPYSAADVVAGLLSSPVTSTNTPPESLPANLNSSNPMPLAPAPAVMLVSHLVISCLNHTARLFVVADDCGWVCRPLQATSHAAMCLSPVKASRYLLIQRLLSMPTGKVAVNQTSSRYLHMSQS